METQTGSEKELFPEYKPRPNKSKSKNTQYGVRLDEVLIEKFRRKLTVMSLAEKLYLEKIMLLTVHSKEFVNAIINNEYGTFEACEQVEKTQIDR